MMGCVKIMTRYGEVDFEHECRSHKLTLITKREDAYRLPNKLLYKIDKLDGITIFSGVDNIIMCLDDLDKLGVILEIASKIVEMPKVNIEPVTPLPKKQEKVIEKLEREIGKIIKGLK